MAHNDKNDGSKGLPKPMKGDLVALGNPMMDITVQANIGLLKRQVLIVIRIPYFLFIHPSDFSVKSLTKKSG
ncbi:adenosine kinase [Biomphalaria pfeifferi]|uniref:Adenosine kinase n=1 Tax=Biomphalaria pfeifferi TaxID=112525 RepID=A0AAD8FAN9_BIOPF|nr:adenosine kinase [Biomphalaria pfeifferi]